LTISLDPNETKNNLVSQPNPIICTTFSVFQGWWTRIAKFY